MPWQAEEREGVVEVIDGDRIVRIPQDFVLAGNTIKIRQEKDGAITIHPATEAGRRALEPFSPVGDWTDEN